MITSNYIKATPNVSTSPTVDEWVRPTDWLTMPTITSTDDTFVGLHAIFPSGNNFAAFRFTTNVGDYQVDWGDGSVTTHASNTTAEYTYDYTTYDPTDTTLSTRGYKQAIIRVTAVSGLLRTCNFQYRRTTTPAQSQPYSTGFLDCIISLPNASAGSSITFVGASTVIHRLVERIDIKTIGLTNNSTSLFSGCGVLQSVPLFDTSKVTDMSGMFQGCAALLTVPLFNTIKVTSMVGMFSGCTALLAVPLFNTIKVTSMVGMFSGCTALLAVPLFNTIKVTSMAGMFTSCTLLQSVPLFNTTLVTHMANMFTSCTLLQSVPLFDTIAVITMSGMFQRCTALQSVPLFNTINVSNMGNMFTLCFTLRSIPQLSTNAIDATSGSDFLSFANGSSTLSRIEMVFARTVTVSSCLLSRDALVEIFNNLVNRTSTTAAAITITGNWGASAGGLSAADRLIATNKNWTITG